MTYLLYLTFSLSVAVLPYKTLEDCHKAAEYYHITYGEELTKTACVKLGDLE